ncbi:MAG: hypothetical protein IKD68_14045 [Solobacterium sp.]|nr:hypothetical protein [Solobacterium sp.]
MTELQKKTNNHRILFEEMSPARALAVMAVPAIASQMIILIYNLADAWFIGRVQNPYMLGALSLGQPVFLVLAALANLFGTGGGSLMARLLGEKKTEDASRIAGYSVACSAAAALCFSIVTLLFLSPLLNLLGASENTLAYGRQYLLFTVVLGAVPAVLSMSMPTIMRNAGYSREAGFGVAIAGILNIILDPIFMFVLLPKGMEVTGAALATLISNILSFLYFLWFFESKKEESVLTVPRRIGKLPADQKKSLYSVGIPAMIAIFLFDLVTMVINRLSAGYGDLPLAAMGIVLKLERIPINIGLGICLGMVPLVAYSYSAGNGKRMNKVFAYAGISALSVSLACIAVFNLFADSIIAAFISDAGVVPPGAHFLKGRSLKLPFMMAGYLIVNYMNAVNRGRVSFLLAVIRHLVLIIPITVFMNAWFGMEGLVNAQLVSDFLSTLFALGIFSAVNRTVLEEIRARGDDQRGPQPDSGA